MISGGRRSVVGDRSVGVSRLTFRSFAVALSVAAASAACAVKPPVVPAAASVEVRPAPLGPAVDHHQHLLSPAAARLLNAVEGSVDQKPVELPAEVSELLRQREAAWNDAKALSSLYSEDAIVVEDGVITGRKAAVEHISDRFARPYRITPVAFSDTGASRRIAAMYTRGEGNERANVGVTLMTLERSASGRWRIASETMKFPGPAPLGDADADALIKLLDQADIERAVVMSVAYFFESGVLPPQPRGAALLRQENDWTAAEVAKYPARLIAFCAVNPLTEQALSEVQRCKLQLGMRGLKLHFGNSAVDLEKPEHLAKIQRVFATANQLGMPVAVHLWSGSKKYGRKDAEIFLADVLPQAPDVVVQIMHMGGGGPGWTDEALEVFASAVEARDPRTRNLYFDVATVADLQTHQQLQLLARRIRQIGPERILYGSDASFGGRNTADQEWGTFRGMVPLTDAEFAVIRDNLAPYLR